MYIIYCILYIIFTESITPKDDKISYGGKPNFPECRKKRQVDCVKLAFSLDCMVNSRPGRTIYLGIISKAKVITKSNK